VAYRKICVSQEPWLTERYAYHRNGGLPKDTHITGTMAYRKICISQERWLTERYAYHRNGGLPKDMHITGTVAYRKIRVSQERWLTERYVYHRNDGLENCLFQTDYCKLYEIFLCRLFNDAVRAEYFDPINRKHLQRRRPDSTSPLRVAVNFRSCTPHHIS
jgi:hypothetical protein